MATAKQIDANRRNAQKSTGPKTEEGRDRVRRNALKHGMTARTVLPQEDPRLQDERIDLYTGDLQPRNALELDVSSSQRGYPLRREGAPKSAKQSQFGIDARHRATRISIRNGETAGQKQSQFSKGEAKSVPILHEGSPTALTKEERIARWNNGCLAFTGASGDDRWKSFFRPVIDQPVDECPDARDE